MSSEAITDEYLDEIEMRANLATPGPWVEYLEARDKISGSDVISTQGEDIYMPGASMADYEFVAHARQDVPKLLNEVRRLRKLLG